MVGFGSAALGGSGVTNGALCAGVAVLSILAGKALAVKFDIGEMKEAWYQEAMQDADQFSEIKGDEEKYPGFMVNRGFSDVADESEVTEDDLRIYKDETIPVLERAKGQSDSEWEDNLDESVVEFMDSMVTEGVKESIGILDIIFALLGIVTAFKVGSGSVSEA